MKSLEVQRAQVIASSVAPEIAKRATPDALAELISLSDPTRFALAYLAQTGLYYDHIDPLLELNGPGQLDRDTRVYLESLFSYSTELKNEDNTEALLPVMTFPARIRMVNGAARVRFLGTSEGPSDIRSSYKAFRRNFWVPAANRFKFAHWTLKTFDSIKLRLLAWRQVQKDASIRQPRLRFNQRAPFVFDQIVHLDIGYNYNPDWYFAIARLKQRYKWKLQLSFVEAVPLKDRMLVIVPLLKICDVVHVRSSSDRNLISKWATFLNVDLRIEGPGV